ncbi:MAG: Rad52/Rad22 family DNA repair protein [Ignavibacterium sp.]|nr:Rad52/Rad22 family DNA repair protein [Ignavibacterium sp.]
MITKEQQEKLKQPINDIFLKKNAYDKFGDGTYVSTDVYVRAMNEVFGPTNWGYKVISKEDHGDFVLVHLALQVNGSYIREEFGIAKKDKKDNSSAFNAALSYALKKSIARLGMFPNLEENWNQPLFAEVKRPISKEELKEKVDDLKQAYNIQTKEEFVRFAQIWDNTIKEYSDLNPEKFLALYDFVKENEHLFENFKA